RIVVREATLAAAAGIHDEDLVEPMGARGIEDDSFPIGGERGVRGIRVVCEDLDAGAIRPHDVDIAGAGWPRAVVTWPGPHEHDLAAVRRESRVNVAILGATFGGIDRGRVGIVR